MKKIIKTILIILMIGGIILAMREVVKGHCGDSKCTYDVYTKEKIDEMSLNLQVLVSGEITIAANGSETASFILPENFTNKNTAILSVNVMGANETYSHINYTGTPNEVYCSKAMFNSNTGVRAYITNGTTAETTVKVAIVLYKYK